MDDFDEEEAQQKDITSQAYYLVSLKESDLHQFGSEVLAAEMAQYGKQVPQAAAVAEKSEQKASDQNKASQKLLPTVQGVGMMFGAQSVSAEQAAGKVQQSMSQEGSAGTAVTCKVMVEQGAFVTR